MQNGAIAYNKNWSMRVVPKALHAYYIDGIPVEDFIKGHDNIYDFCIGFKAKKPWEVYASGIEDVNGEYKKFHKRQQGTIRYFMSKNGVMLTKENPTDGRIISIEAGKTAVVFNRYHSFEKFSDYNIDYSYYIQQAKKIIYAVDDGQLKMF